MNEDYLKFIDGKRKAVTPDGIEPGSVNEMLFPFQRDIVRWALKMGRAAIFADCGLGKTFMQTEWARQIPGDVLILAPLAVAQQTIAEADRIGVTIRYCRSGAEVQSGITIANYEMLDRFDCSRFAGVVLDESSILKAFMGKTKRSIVSLFKGTKYKLACTATPAPNDYMELGNHAEFLGVMESNEMLAKYFINDPSQVGKYKLKGHAQGKFFEWMAGWCAAIRKPSDLGYSDEGFTLPRLTRHMHVVDVIKPAGGQLFALPASSLSERIKARSASVEERVHKAIEIANSTDEQVLIWCALNNEADALEDGIEGAIQVAGADTAETKTKTMLDFANGKLRVLVSKPKICGFGMNFQSCHHVIFVGLTDSFEQYYQAIRRCWRFGQKHEVQCHIVSASTEGSVVANVLRKESDSVKMFEELVRFMAPISQGVIHRAEKFKVTYDRPDNITIPSWLTSTN